VTFPAALMRPTEPLHGPVVVNQMLPRARL
jgi:hypothetical protein